MIRRLENMIKIQIFTVLHKRYELTDYVLGYYEQLKGILLTEGIEIDLLAVGSDEKDKEITEKHGFKFLMHPNRPVSTKHNAGAYAVKEIDADYYLYIGSDNLIDINTFKFYKTLISLEYHIIGIKDVFYLTKDRLGYWGGYQNHRKGEPVGPGKLFSKHAMERLGWLPWAGPGINEGLDGLYWNNVLKTFRSNEIFVFRVFEIDGMLLDVKTNTNISNINNYQYDNEFSVDILKSFNIDYEAIEPLLITKKN